MDEQLRVRVQALATKLASMAGSYENQLSKRLQTILEAPQRERPDLIRHILFLADQNWFQSKIDGYAAIVADLKARPGAFARECTETANQSRLEAQREHDAIRELMALE